uniref:TFIIS N-terminal domain-containing protein n=1 Tax=Nelumbo nucifera TaxID=4432 RepID=A0A822ZEI5_NELNU|nr:TPA_asm: hypothetical protein HUJ06_001150 [Nelumbo nucifera]
MDAKSGNLDYWRKYFRSANLDIFEVIEHAIMVASSDCPEEFKMRRDRIAEMLFCCRMTRCFGCDRVELQVPAEEGDGDCKNGGDFEGHGGKESKVNSSSNDNNEMNMIRVSNYSYDEAEALTEEIEEESQIVKEVLRIKDVLANSEEESEGVIFESLRRLQLMALSVDTLKATEIGRAVNNVRKHGSKEIRHLARTLISGWKVMVDEWVRSANAITGSPDSVNPSTLDEEEGLPSPPLDEGFFLATQTTGIELSQFFDGMDDDGNPRNSGELDNNRENGRKMSLDNHNIPRRKQQPPHGANMLTKENKGQQVHKLEPVIKQTKPFATDTGPGRPPKLSLEHRANNETKSQQKPESMGIQRRPIASQQDKSKCSDEFSVRVKLEATKRKLQEGYQQAENAKRQRTIQVMELHDLPKQGMAQRNPHMRPGNHNRYWANGRR